MQHQENVLLSFLVLKSARPHQQPTNIDVELEELLFVVSVKFQLHILPLKSILFFRAFLYFLKVENQLSSFDEFFDETLAYIIFV